MQAALDALRADVKALRDDVDTILYVLNRKRKDLAVGPFPLVDRVQALENSVAELERIVASQFK